ncbi:MULTISPECIES: hypothetical protein [Streptomyces]|uniref:Uncharacterized protein n=1 Tax=Streptomyces koelreuteriae TaxID=2838015 RepID=A0ABX8G2Y0_9ACTN|nr:MULTISPECIES: hypothetical protein [Streptomyces]QWB27719.1 hypothetical protein KJK29_36805 [Streptomyces koelreuteriae]UUA10820.1 hypothetical protein NNW98_37015 [Streptomyces koelreuteriae]UUA18427.1 hypothetical protein NNW99_36900 [Streptomyces sp. CRCS-T-1]
MQVADALREATQPDVPRYGNGQAPTTTTTSRDSNSSTTVTVNGDR